jgi:cold shock CspA family protein
MVKMEGKITQFFPDRGYGFIVSLSEDSDLFFHKSDLAPDSAPASRGKFVTFEIGTWRGQRKAVNVRVLAGGAQ